MTSINNPYLTEALPYLNSWDGFNRRSRLCLEYSWAVPSYEAIQLIRRHTDKIVEIGAGSGYWAALLDAVGCDVAAYDIQPWNETFYPVQVGGVENAAFHPTRSLFLCWPPYATSMAYDALRQYEGDLVIYIGEGYGGCTADDNFHYLLENDWKEIAVHNIPQWWGIHDSLMIYKRKET